MAHLVRRRAALVVGHIPGVATEGAVEDPHAVPGLADDASPAGQVRVAEVAAGGVDVDVQVPVRVPADLVVVGALVVVPRVARVAIDPRRRRAVRVRGREVELDPTVGPGRAGAARDRVEVLVEHVDLALDARVAHVPDAIGPAQDVDDHGDPVEGTAARVVGRGRVGPAGVAVPRGQEDVAPRTDAAIVCAAAHAVLQEEARAVEVRPVVEDLRAALVDRDDVAGGVLVDVAAVGVAGPERALGEGRGRGEEERQEEPSGMHAFRGWRSAGRAPLEASWTQSPSQ